jgi:hypothetical protein
MESYETQTIVEIPAPAIKMNDTPAERDLQESHGNTEQGDRRVAAAYDNGITQGLKAFRDSLTFSL